MHSVISIPEVARIKADANHGRLELQLYDKAGEFGQFVTFAVGSQGLALRLAGAINLVQQDDISPIYPAAREKEAAA